VSGTGNDLALFEVGGNNNEELFEFTIELGGMSKIYDPIGTAYKANG